MASSEMSEAELEDRLISLSVLVTDLLEALPDHHVAHHIADQLLRSGRLPGPGNGDAQSTGSGREGVHTMKSILGELQETSIWLRIIRSRSLMESSALLERALDECHRLIAIVVSGIAAAQTPVQESIDDRACKGGERTAEDRSHAYALSSGH